MPITNYPFIPLGLGHPPRPMLPIRIINPDNNLSMLALGLIDTGADQCSIPADFAVVLGHNLTAGSAKMIGTAGGPTKAYGHATRIDIFSINHHSSLVHTIQSAPVDFTPGLHVVLLGVENFLSNFTLKIDYPNQRFSIKRS